MKVSLVPKWVLPFGYGLTLWKWVLVRKDSENLPYVIAHEAEHVRQWTSNGFFKFIWLYAKELYMNGYEDNAYERQARYEGAIKSYLYKREYLDSDLPTYLAVIGIPILVGSIGWIVA